MDSIVVGFSQNDIDDDLMAKMIKVLKGKRLEEFKFLIGHANISQNGYENLIEAVEQLSD